MLNEIWKRCLRRDLQKIVVDALFGYFWGNLKKGMDVDPGEILKRLGGV